MLLVLCVRVRETHTQAGSYVTGLRISSTVCRLRMYGALQMMKDEGTAECSGSWSVVRELNYHTSVCNAHNGLTRVTESVCCVFSTKRPK